jgi:hypothetical protein
LWLTRRAQAGLSSSWRESAEADLPAAILLIGGQKLLWNNDSEVVVTLA